MGYKIDTIILYNINNLELNGITISIKLIILYNSDIITYKYIIVDKNKNI